MSDVILSARGIRKSFAIGRSGIGRQKAVVHAVDGVDLELRRGTTVGIVGESGSGKTTLARILSLLEVPDSGSVLLDGQEIVGLRGRRLQELRRELQVVFQDPYGALDPTKSVEHAIIEPLVVHRRLGGRRSHQIAGELLERVALDPVMMSRHPDELSGGQRQRVCIARALALSPRILVADEPTSALDLSTRAEILNLLLTLQSDLGLSMILVSHDFATVRHLAHDLLVMYRGSVVESGDARSIADDPQNVYTQALISAVPVPNPVVQRERQRIVMDAHIDPRVHR